MSEGGETVKLTIAGKQYRSLPVGFCWDSIPNFAVVVGPNGSGKTHLLTALNEALQGREHGVVISSSAGSPVREKATFVPKFQLSAPQAIGPDLETAASRSNPVFQRSKADYGSGYAAAFREYDWRSAGHDLASRMARGFRAHHLQQLEEIRKGNAPDSLGPPPWEMVNALLEASELPYCVNDPGDVPVAADFVLNLRHHSHDSPIGFADLSSGEHAIVALAFFLYAAHAGDCLPAWVLLDEPDASLHTAMIPAMLKSLRDDLVRDRGTRVIMTTHRCDTIALVGADHLFEVSADRTNVRQVRSKHALLATLSASVLSVLPFTRCVLVEDTADVEFYRDVLNIMLKHGLVEAVALPTFEAASVSAAGKAGGCTVVEGWVQKLAGAGLSPLVVGIVDGDDSAKATHGVRRLERYSIENYLLDPLVVYGALIEKGKADDVPRLARRFGPGSSRDLAALDQEELQAIADHVINKIEPKLRADAAELEREPVEFSNGKTLQYPRWLLKRKGHELLALFRDHVAHRPCDPVSLRLSMQRIGILPLDLVNLVRSLTV